MNDANDRPTRPDLLDEATGALRAAPVPAGPPADLVASTVEAIQSRTAGTAPAPAARPPRRRRLMAYLGYGSLAAAVLVGFGLFGLDGNAAAALDKAFDKVEQADAVRFHVTTTLEGRAQPANVVTVRGEKLRVEGLGQVGLTWVIDRDKKAALITHPKAATYQTVDMTQGGVAPVEVLGMNVPAQLLALRKQKAEAAGAEKVGDVLADKFVIKDGKAFHLQGDWTVWVGRDSGLPVKVSVEAKLQGRAMTRVYEAFDWAAKPDAATFAIDPPKDFTEAVLLRTFPPLPPRK